eukprot:m.115430 g.115430  ORF g.115430 m.115430 type:complete len:152 (+) comp28422_c2_seq1:306-761(+)
MLPMWRRLGPRYTVWTDLANGGDGTVRWLSPDVSILIGVCAVLALVAMQLFEQLTRPKRKTKSSSSSAAEEAVDEAPTPISAEDAVLKLQMKFSRNRKGAYEKPKVKKPTAGSAKTTPLDPLVTAAAKAPKMKIAGFRKQEEHGAKKYIKP